jgi:hypothetical protein
LSSQRKLRPTNRSPHKLLTGFGKVAKGHRNDRGDGVVPDGERGRMKVPTSVPGIRRDDRVGTSGRPRVAAERSGIICVSILHNVRHLPAVVRAGDGLLEVRVQLGRGREPLPGGAGLRSRLRVGDFRVEAIAPKDFSNAIRSGASNETLCVCVCVRVCVSVNPKICP